MLDWRPMVLTGQPCQWQGALGSLPHLTGLFSSSGIKPDEQSPGSAAVSDLCFPLGLFEIFLWLWS